MRGNAAGVICCLAVICSLSGVVTSQGTTLTDDEAMVMLKKLAYMGPDNPDSKFGELSDPQAYPMALRTYQSMNGLDVTGVLDQATMDLMVSPRCGNPDVINKDQNSFSMSRRKKRRRRRYALQGSKWPRTELTYRISRYTGDMSQSDVDSEIRRAFGVWEMVTPLRFTRVAANQRVDIDIIFASGEHGDGSPFDGPGRTLAHAYFPQYGGDSHFDESERWTLRTSSGTNLFQVAAHEFGHALGLSHSSVRGALMYAYYSGYQADFSLNQDDISGIQALYGRSTSGGSTTQRPPNPETTRRTNQPATTTTPRPELVPDLRRVCDAGRVDAFTKHTINGQTRYYAFYRDLYMLIDGEGIAQGYPKKISDDWAGLPNNLDTAIHMEAVYGYRWTWNNGWRYTRTETAPERTYFFKGSQYWRVENGRVKAGYPRSVSAWGLPSNLDAAFTWSGNGRVYFMKGSQYYRINTDNTYVDSDYPRPLSVWDSSLTSVDAAIMTSDRTYFFVADQYYRYNDRRQTVDQNYPRSTSQLWFGCDRFQNIMDDNQVGGASQVTCSTLLSITVTLLISLCLLH